MDEVDDHSSRAAVADSLEHATRSRRRTPGRGQQSHVDAMLGNCLRLHAVGFAVPRLSPVERCALTAPFHPYPPDVLGAGGLFSVALSLAPRPEPVGVTHHRGPTVFGLSSALVSVSGDRLSTPQVYAGRMVGVCLHCRHARARTGHRVGAWVAADAAARCADSIEPAACRSGVRRLERRGSSLGCLGRPARN